MHYKEFTDKDSDLVILKFFRSEILVDIDRIAHCLNATQKIANEAGLRTLNKSSAAELENNLDDPDVRLFQGGSQALFAASFPVDDLPFNRIIVKPYADLTLAQCVMHCTSFFQFRELFAEKEFLAGIQRKEKWRIRGVYTIGFGKIQVEDREILALIQEFSDGEANISPLFKISNIIIDVRKAGFVIDPYISNYRLSTKIKHNYIEYIDLIFSNNQENVKARAKEITGLDI